MQPDILLTKACPECTDVTLKDCANDVYGEYVYTCSNYYRDEITA